MCRLCNCVRQARGSGARRIDGGGAAPRRATPRCTTPPRPTVMRRSAAVAAAVKSEEEEAKVHFCDDVPAIKWQWASELAVVCGGAARRSRGKVII